MYIVGKYKFISETLETGRKASLYNFFLAYSAESANKKDFKGHFMLILLYEFGSLLTVTLRCTVPLLYCVSRRTVG
jgi:hypothetical protein